MNRFTGVGEIVDGFLRGGAWGAMFGVFIAMVEVAPLFLD